MKALYLLIFLFAVSSLFATEVNEKEVKSKVNEVTVFIEGAQVIRKKSIEIISGITLLKFVNLSPFIDAKSVQIKADGKVTVLSVSHQNNYIKKLDRPLEINEVESKIIEIERNIELEQTYLSILAEELEFLRANKSIGGKYNELSVTNLKDASDYYSAKLTKIKLDEINRNVKITELEKNKNALQKQLQTLSSKKEYPTGEILVKVKSEAKNISEFELSYIVNNAGWFPTYDIRAKNINEPIDIIYKANLRQDTKVNWDNVKLKFSSSNPNTSSVAPALNTYYLSYNSKPSVYRKTINTVNGQVSDYEYTPLPGVNVKVPGTTIGTVTDINGRYSITLPTNSKELSFSFIGYVTKTLPVTKSEMHVFLDQDNVSLDEVVVVGYGAQNRMGLANKLQGSVAGVQIRGASSITKGKSESIAIPFQQTENQTSIDFEIKTPYTVKSDNKNYSVDMTVYKVDAFFQYFSIPKIDNDAFLIANITEWEKYNLLEGEANIYFEDTYIGKTLLDVRFSADTLQLSLGRDKNVSVKREKVKDHTTRQFIGTKKEETRAWKTTVKNNKKLPINMIVLDQIPVSKLEEIEVTLLNFSKAKYNEENGEVKWEFELNTTETKEMNLRYAVKYPKWKQLLIE